ncbi:hypothetical protein EXW96_16875 [Paenibacillus sp. JMULE4]|uniref:hypothetical protein n=1 Tax=Paenibacillus sp. JMULE4 TaxID=2518342 RepID=UPI001575F872|nr:hypothetical protein [Paenibacillus sp. JMULE4]NTZ19182.1 hypothetical protein [Paenibacillus sp. JMULE4]
MKKNGIKFKKMIPSKAQFRDSFSLDRAPFVLTSDDLGEGYRSEFFGKTLQKAFSLARYVDSYREKPFTTEAKAFIHKEIELLDELNVNDNSDANEVIGYFKEIKDLILEGRSLGGRSKGIVRLIKEKIVKVAVEQDLLKMIDL